MGTLRSDTPLHRVAFLFIPMTDHISLQQQVLDDELLTREQVAKLLGLVPLTITRMISRGEFPCVRYSRRIRVRASDVRIWLRARTTSAKRNSTDEEESLAEFERAVHTAYHCEHVAALLASLITKVTVGPTPGLAPSEISPVPDEQPTEKLLDPKEVAAFLGVSTVTVLRMLRARKLPAFRVGKRRLIRKDDLEIFLQRSRVTEASSTHA